MKKIMACMLLFVLTAILFGCSNNKEETYRTLTEEELSQFIKDKNIEVITVEELQDSTLVLYESGIYYLSKSGGEINQSSVGWSGNKKQKVQIGMTSTGSPHVSVILNDEELIGKAHKVEVKFGDGKTVNKLFEGKRGALIFYDKSKTNVTIEGGFKLKIYDKNDTVIYEDSL